MDRHHPTSQLPTLKASIAQQLFYKEFRRDARGWLTPFHGRAYKWRIYNKARAIAMDTEFPVAFVVACEWWDQERNRYHG